MEITRSQLDTNLNTEILQTANCFEALKGILQVFSLRSKQIFLIEHNYHQLIDWSHLYNNLAIGHVIIT